MPLQKFIISILLCLSASVANIDANAWESTRFTRIAHGPYVAINPATDKPQVAYAADAGATRVVYLDRLDKDGTWKPVDTDVPGGGIGEGYGPIVSVNPRGESYLSFNYSPVFGDEDMAIGDWEGPGRIIPKTGEFLGEQGNGAVMTTGHDNTPYFIFADWGATGTGFWGVRATVMRKQGSEWIIAGNDHFGEHQPQSDSLWLSVRTYDNAPYATYVGRNGFDANCVAQTYYLRDNRWIRYGNGPGGIYDCGDQVLDKARIVISDNHHAMCKMVNRTVECYEYDYHSQNWNRINLNPALDAKNKEVSEIGMALHPSGVPYLSFFNEKTRKLVIARKNGNAYEYFDELDSSYPSLAIDGRGMIYALVRAGDEIFNVDLVRKSTLTKSMGATKGNNTVEALTFSPGESMFTVNGPDVSATFTSSNPNTALTLDENAGEVTATVQTSNPDSNNTVLPGDATTISGPGNPDITVKATSEGHIWAYSGTENGEAPFYSSEIPESSLYIDEGILTTQVPVSDDAILWIMTRIEDLAETHFQVEDSLVFTDIVDSTTISGVHIREARPSNYGISKPMDKAQVVVEITEEL